MSYVKQLWRGEIPLVITFWVYGFFVSSVLSTPFNIMIEYNYSIEAIGRYYDNLDIGFALIFLIYVILLYGFVFFMWVAIWRSANLYQGPRSWAVLAKATVVITSLSFGLALGNLLR